MQSCWLQLAISSWHSAIGETGLCGTGTGVPDTRFAWRGGGTLACARFPSLRKQGLAGSPPPRDPIPNPRNPIPQSGRGRSGVRDLLRCSLAVALNVAFRSERLGARGQELAAALAQEAV
jgi:hypothetical protein